MARPSFFFLSGDRALVAHRDGPFADSLHGLRAAFGAEVALFVAAPGRGDAFEWLPNLRVLPLGRSRRVRGSMARRAVESALQSGAHPLLVHHLHGLDGAARAVWMLRERLRAWVSEVHHLSPAADCFGWRGRLEARILAARIRKLATRVDAFRVVEERRTPALLRALGVPPERIELVEAVYLDTHFFAPDDAIPRDLDLLWVAPWTIEKGRHLCRQIVAALAQQRSPLRVALIGRGVQRATRSWSCRKLQVEAHEHVERAQLRNYYRRARVLLVTSSVEGGPRVAAEALACGTPLVSTDVGRVREWMSAQHCGKLAAADVPSLVQAIVSTWQSAHTGMLLRRTMHPVLQRCDRERTLAAYADFLMRTWQRGSIA